MEYDWFFEAFGFIRLFHKYFRFFNGLQTVKIFRIVKVHDKTLANIFEMCSLNLNSMQILFEIETSKLRKNTNK